jgi:hypothetical protein
MNTSNEIFVFGSNLAGRHGKGAALYAARHHGAKYGQGIGIQGQSYAIPTKDGALGVLPLERIRDYVDDFITYAEKNPQLTFNVTAIGCGLAGYKPYDIGPMFRMVPDNVNLPDEFREYLTEGKYDDGRC